MTPSRALSSMMQMAWDNGYRKDNPVRGIKLEGVPAKPIIVAAKDQFLRVCNALPHQPAKVLARLGVVGHRHRTTRLRLTGHTGPVWGVAYRPDGRTLASVGLDGTIRIWNPRNGAQVNGTGFGVPRAPARPLARVRSDSPSAEDLLGVGGDVETLAELIAATETRPPLAIALIGDWGAGKSSVMLQVEQHIGVLADRARNNPGLSAFAENVRQVRFNAWHYSDDHLWAGLVSHLFEVLAAPAPPPADEAPTDQRTVAAERERLRGDLAAKREASDKLAGELKAADAVRRPVGALGWLGSPWFAARVLLAAARQGFRDGKASLAALFGRAEVESAAQHRQAVQQAAFGVVEQLITPRDQRLQRPVPSRAGRPARQQPGMAIQPCGQLSRTQSRAPGRGQFDGQGHAVQPGAHLRDCGSPAGSCPLGMFTGSPYIRVTVVGTNGGRTWSNPIWLR